VCNRAIRRDTKAKVLRIMGNHAGRAIERSAIRRFV
jgi:hypothetical protein